MPAPVLKSFAADLYARLAPVATQEADNGYALANYLGAIGEMFQILEDYGRAGLDSNGDPAPGWSQLLDINRCPTEALPWLGQFVGVRVTQGLSDALMRQQIQAEGGWRRGTPAAIAAAAAATLTGRQEVIVIERDPVASATWPAYGLTVHTRISQTPDTNKTLAAILSVKPGGIVLNYSAIADTTYQDIFTNYATYQTVFNTFHTYQGVLENTPGL